ncbi:hypothetical protein H4R20_006277 [Coemansia guatemalensis]|uniref:Translation initiation factor eIF2B subunit delta n=1 Tax=Coemansia guatemalensis TaxID=2761395 RepID=A0A9W8HR56_9FUNG|nr:hypothetical protein H4R20_006277 [Coemansia guatemalensis]
MTKAERRALQEKQRAAKQENQGRGQGSTSGGGGGGGREAREQRTDIGNQHASAAAAGSKNPKVNMDKRVVPEDKRMYLYLHLDLPQHPPSSAPALAHGQSLDTNHSAAEHGAGDSSAFDAGIKNAAFPPGPQVVVGMARDDYAAAEANEPAIVRIPGASGKPTSAVLRDAMPPFASGAGQRRLPKPSGSTVGIAVHPRIKEVGLRMATMDISGSNARTVAVMLAFVDVIADYTTPPNTTLVYHLTGYLSPQINFLVHQRPMCIGMANAIRWLKSEIIHTSHDLKDDEAKSQLISKIDGYIKERITAAGDIIADAGAQKIQDGDVVLTFGASSAVQNLLITARNNGRRFHVIVIDSRPENEGRGLVRKLVEAGFSSQQSADDAEDARLTAANANAYEKSKGGSRTGLSDGVTYASLTALSLLMREASKVFLGAEAFFANGNMLSRAGTAMVALSAHSCHVPVIVTCETYKFNERIQLDAVVNNELGVPDALMYKAGVPDAEPVGPQSDRSLSAMEYSAYARDKYSARPRWNNRNSLNSDPSTELAGTGKKTKGAKGGAASSDMSPEAAALTRLNKVCPLSDWRTNQRLRLLNLTQDVTPPEFVSVIITEVGMIPTTSIPVVLREYKNQI